MPFVGFARTFDKKFAFTVEIDGFTSAGFMKCSALEAEVKEIQQHEGGALIPNKSAGRVEYKDVTLERGATRLDWDAMAWFAQVAGAPVQTPLAREPFYKRHLSITQRDRDGTPTRRYDLFGAWPKTFVAGEWDNTVDENVIEKLTLCYDYYLRVPL